MFHTIKRCFIAKLFAAFDLIKCVVKETKKY